MKILLLFFFSLLFFHGPCAALTLYVRSSSSADSSDCTSASSPCASLSYAILQFPNPSAPDNAISVLADPLPLTHPGSCDLLVPTGMRLSITGTFAYSPGAVSAASVLAAPTIDCLSRGRIALVQPGASLTLDSLALANLYAGPGSPSGASGGGVSVTEGSVTVRSCAAANVLADGSYFDAIGGFIFSSSAQVAFDGFFLDNATAGLAGGFGLVGSTQASFSRLNVSRVQCLEGAWAGVFLCEEASNSLITDSEFTHNYGSYGGVMDDGGTAVSAWHRNRFAHNSARFGGVYYSFGDSASTWVDCVFEDNAVTASGAAVYLSSTSLVSFQGCRFASNAAPSSGGAIYDEGSPRLDVSRCDFVNNSASAGGGCIISKSNTPFQITDSAFSGCATDFEGGAIQASLVFSDPSASATLRNLTFAGNRAATGGAAFFAAATIAQSAAQFSATLLRFVDNTAAQDGAGLYFRGRVDASLTQTSFVNNSAQRSGGAVFVSTRGSLTLSPPNDMRGNSAFTGGAVSMDADSALVASSLLVADNDASIGGGIALGTNVWLDLQQCSFSGNAAEVGSAIYLSQADTPEGCFLAPSSPYLRGNNTAFSGNVAVQGGTVFLSENYLRGQSTSLATCDVQAITQMGRFADDNAAGYGPRYGTTPSFYTNVTLLNHYTGESVAIENADTLPPAYAVWPGASLELRGSIIDFLGQTVTSAASIMQMSVATQGENGGCASVFGTTLITPIPDEGSFVFSIELASGFNGSHTLPSCAFAENAPINFTLEAIPHLATKFSFALYMQPCLPGWELLPTSASTAQCFERLQISEGGLIGIGIGLGIAFALCLLAAAWVFKYRFSFLLKASAPISILISLAGVFVCIAAAYMWFDNNDAMCALRVWLLPLGMSLVYPVLVLKQLRLLLVFRSTTKFRQSTTRTSHYYLAILLMGLLPNCILLIVWFSISPFISVNHLDYGAQTVVTLCRSQNSTADIVILSLLLVVNILPLLVAFVVFLMSHRIFANHNETLYLSCCVIAALVGFAAAVPIVIALPHDIDAQFFAPTIAIMAVIFIVLLCLVGQRMVLVYFTSYAINREKALLTESEQKVEFYQKLSQA